MVNNYRPLWEVSAAYRYAYTKPEHGTYAKAKSGCGGVKRVIRAAEKFCGGKNLKGEGMNG